ncbi:MAG: D-aminoacyl-tRNA deacylase [Candidatus Aceula meridiana]|nr:D-aminoacyl-tRNA deacylase [Candidatus Aceula meridiana]
MRIVIQRVKESEVTVSGQSVGRIGLGLVVLLAVGKDDTAEDIDYLTKKLAELRIFEDKDGKMNCSIQEAGGAFLVVSQFTLLGDCKKGRRPSFDKAAEPKRAEEMYNQFIESLRFKGFKVSTGEFRAMMDVSLVNDGPVTFILDSKA